MSLNVYIREEDIPRGMKYVMDNDALFFNDYNNGLVITKGIVDLIKVTDRGIVVDNKSMISYLGMLTSLLNLSTSTKMVLNVINHPDMCISTVECGSNIVPFIFQQPKGNIFMAFLPSCPTMKISAKLIYGRGSKQFYDLEALSDYAYTLLSGI